MDKRVFISQPMRGKSEDEIISERSKAIEKVREHYGDVDVIDSYIEGESSTKNDALYKLGQSLQMLADADVAVFINGWDDARGCRIENTAAIEYGIEVMEIYSD